MKKRLAFAVLVALAVYVVAERITSALTPPPAQMADPDGHFWLLSGISGVVCVLAASAGSWIAPGRFLKLALVLWAIPTAAAMVVGYRLQLPAEPITFGVFALRNLPMLSATLAGTLAGVVLGKSLAGHKRVADGTPAAT